MAYTPAENEITYRMRLVLYRGTVDLHKNRSHFRPNEPWLEFLAPDFKDSFYGKGGLAGIISTEKAVKAPVNIKGLRGYLEKELGNLSTRLYGHTQLQLTPEMASYAFFFESSLYRKFAGKLGLKINDDSLVRSDLRKEKGAAANAR